MKRKNKIRVFWGSMILVLALIITSQIGNASTEKEYIKITVHPGDTLWTIAQEYGDPSKDIREVVDDIKSSNQLKSAGICAGQSLRIPQ